MTEKILICENDHSHSKIIANSLINEGYFVKTVRTGKEAIENLSSDYGIIIVNILLPDINGVMVLKQIKERFPTMAVVMMTESSSPEHSIESLNAGADYFLRKPVNTDELLRVSNKILLRKKKEMPGKGIGELKVEVSLESWIELTVNSREEYVERLHNFFEIIYGSRIPNADKENIKVAFTELLQNAIEWGNKDEVNKRISVTYCRFDDRLMFKIEDQGEGFNIRGIREKWNKSPEDYLTDRMLSGKRPGGYGLMLATQLMDEVYFSEKGNIVLLTKYFKSTP